MSPGLKKARSKAGLSAWTRHHKAMMPWSYVLFCALAIGPLLLVLFLIGLVPLWVPAAWVPAVLVVYVVWDKETDKTNDTWGEGARGEFRVGAELERLHEEGFYVFHDWDSGHGNVDHFVVGPTGVFAVETKAWTGKITKVDDYFLARNSNVIRGKGDPISQARRNARKVGGLVARSSRVRGYVTPVLCFTKAEVACYGRVRKVEVTTLGSLNSILADPDRPRLYAEDWEGFKDEEWDGYSPQEVRAIAHRLEETLGVAPAAGPGAPPDEPSRTDRLFRWMVATPTSAVVLSVLAVVFVVSLIFPKQSSDALLGFAYLYHLLAEALGNLF